MSSSFDVCTWVARHQLLWAANASMPCMNICAVCMFMPESSTCPPPQNVRRSTPFRPHPRGSESYPSRRLDQLQQLARETCDFLSSNLTRLQFQQTTTMSLGRSDCASKRRRRGPALPGDTMHQFKDKQNTELASSEIACGMYTSPENTLVENPTRDGRKRLGAKNIPPCHQRTEVVAMQDTCAREQHVCPV